METQFKASEITWYRSFWKYFRGIKSVQIYSDSKFLSIYFRWLNCGFLYWLFLFYEPDTYLFSRNVFSLQKFNFSEIFFQLCFSHSLMKYIIAKAQLLHALLSWLNRVRRTTSLHHPFWQEWIGFSKTIAHKYLNIAPNLQISINILNTAPNTDSLHLPTIHFKVWYWKNNLMAIYDPCNISLLCECHCSQYVFLSPNTPPMLQAISVGTLSFAWLLLAWLYCSQCAEQQKKTLFSWNLISLL